EDALNGIVWEDDWQVVYIQATKYMEEEEPRTEVYIWPIDKKPLEENPL
ncbi:hypothetical protein LCGC14_1776880, partial [marine sediment metagenome]